MGGSMGQVTRLSLSPAPAGTHRDTHGHPLCWLPSGSSCCARLGRPQRSRERAQGRIYILCLCCAAVSVTRSSKVGSHVVQERGWGVCLCSGRGVGLSLLCAGARAGHVARGTDRMQKPWVCVCLYPSWCKKGHHTSLSLPAGQQRKCQR